MATKFSILLTTLFILSHISIRAQDKSEIIQQIDSQLKSGQTTISKVLSDDVFLKLHTLTPFRDVIKENATPGKITIVTISEPGIHLTIKGTIVNKAGIPQKDLLLYFYQTSNLGWYADTAAHVLMNDGDMKHARLFGYLKTDDRGQFSFETIKPIGYTKSSLTGNIHVQYISQENKSLTGPEELQFDDDPRMTWERRKQTLEEGNLIAKNTGTSEKPVYEYMIIVQ
ncbi:MAG: hypothetical protein ABJC12_13840 [Saprospiraceae bacterium]